MPFNVPYFKTRQNQLKIATGNLWFRGVVRALVLGGVIWVTVFALFWMRVQEANLTQQLIKSLSVNGFVLRMDDAVSASLRPVFGLKVGRMALADPQGKTILTIERSVADLYFWPLLWGEPMVSGLTLTGVNADLNETQPNVWPLALWWQSLQAQPSTIKLNLEQIEVQGLTLTLNAYLNQTTKQGLSVQDGQLKLSNRLAAPIATFS
ncbi:MAG: hypothetical protein K2P98_06485, partial [Neisseriaceae bacterium]|nr:hypothetical protein [Neisseriaceae bacterium]